MSKNDDKILELRAKIQAEKDKLDQSAKRYMPVTTCVFNFKDTFKLNLRTLSANELNQALIVVQSLIEAASAMNLTETTFSGFSLEQWKADIIGIRDQLTVSERKLLIAKYEAKLKSMLSSDKRTELEISDIQELLGL